MILHKFVQKIVLFILILFLISIAYGYKVDPDENTVVHQHIANESKDVWTLIPWEIKSHLENPITDPLDTNYDFGNDIITGSGEEDTDLWESTRLFNRNHFWDVDDTTKYSYDWDYYDRGLYDSSISPVESAYTKAKRYWETKVIPLYIKGEIDEAYYWLGRVAHLLEDATVPAHMHLDPHYPEWAAGDDSLEEYTGDNWNNYDGMDNSGNQYDYDNLPNMSNFNWAEVDPTRPSDKQNIELFRLFWYTAQKTQYFASDDKDGNNQYVNLSNAQKVFPTPLWFEEGISVLNESEYLAQDDVTNSGDNITRVANATIPHAMKATAGLYKLFWDAVHVDWPTDHHDFRRTGFTLLKGDMNETSDVEKIDIVLEDDLTSDIVLRPSVADLDGNGYMDTVTVMHDTYDANKTTLYIIERNKKFEYKGYGFWWQTEEKYNQNLGSSSMLLPPTLGNIDGDTRKEIILGLRNGTIMVLDVNEDGSVISKWNYSLPEKYSSVAGSSLIELGGGSAIADIDLDGTNDIILTDKGTTSTYDWPGEVYVIDGSSSYNKKYNYTFGNGGAYASVSVANIDDDDNPEIIVPSFYGIYVFDYNTSASHKLSKKWSNEDGLILGSAVVYDVDRDNEYEIVYVTTDGSGSASKQKYDRLYIRDAKTGNNEANSPISIEGDARVTPAIANLDSDSQAEIVISLRDSPDTEYGKIIAFDSSTGQQQWNFTDSSQLKTSFVAPDIADIDNDGNYNIIFAENNGTNVFILNNDGTELFRYDFNAFVDSALAIADLDGDSIAEIALKRAGSPVGILSTASGYNDPPVLSAISNITAIAGDLININESGEVTATDQNNDNPTFYYSSPFNSSGLWQTTINDTGNYSILVEVSDNSLSDYQYVDVIVFNSTAILQNNFTDSTNQKILNFSSAGNLTVKIRLPKNATILYSKIKLEGKAP